MAIWYSLNGIPRRAKYLAVAHRPQRPRFLAARIALAACVPIVISASLVSLINQPAMCVF